MASTTLPYRDPLVEALLQASRGVRAAQGQQHQDGIAQALGVGPTPMPMMTPNPQLEQFVAEPKEAIEEGPLEKVLRILLALSSRDTGEGVLFEGLR